MGYGDMGMWNQEVETPALDSIARSGASFQSMYASSPVCAPARASLFTGRYPQRTGVSDTLDIRGLDRLDEREVTAADYFRSSGYTTALVGKWHLGDGKECYHPLSRGFDHFWGFCGGWSDYYEYALEEEGSFVRYSGEYITEVLTDRAVEFIRKQGDEPFFLHVAYTAPHYPLQAPQELVRKHQRRGDVTKGVATLRAMIEVMDRGIARLLATLEERGLKDETLVIFASDNGPDLHGENEMDLSRYNCGLKGEKTLVYEGGIAVPHLMRLPGLIEEGSTITEPLCGIDLLPSLMSICSLTPDPHAPSFDGIDFSPLFRVENIPSRELFWHWNRYSPEPKVNAALRSGDYKLIHSPRDAYLQVPQEELQLDTYKAYHREEQLPLLTTPFPRREEVKEATRELYDLGTDRREQQDLSQREPKRTEELEKRLSCWVQELYGSR